MGLREILREGRGSSVIEGEATAVRSLLSHGRLGFELEQRVAAAVLAKSHVGERLFDLAAQSSHPDILRLPFDADEGVMGPVRFLPSRKLPRVLALAATAIGAVCAAPVVAAAPPAPTDVTAAPHDASVHLRWNAATGASGYRVYMGTTPGGESAEAAASTTSNAATIAGLTNGTPYYFRVRAYGSKGRLGPNSEEVGATPVAPPPAPKGLTASPHDSYVHLKWKASAGATAYRIYLATISGGEKAPAIRISTHTAANITGLANGTRYFFEVKAYSRSAGLGPASAEVSAVPAAASPSCSTALATGIEYECRVPPLAGRTTFSLVGAPEGMVIQPRSGYLHWTPAPGQEGTYPVIVDRDDGSYSQQDPLRFEVAAGSGAAAPGIYVSTGGSDANPGTPASPLLTLQEAADRAVAGDTIYLRGGRYFNAEYGSSFEARRYNSLVRITRSGTVGDWITIRPYGNEYAQLISDVNGIALTGTRYWRLQGLEIAGTNRSLSRDISLSLWWVDTGAESRILGRGVAMNGSYDIEIRDCVIHDFPGAGLSNNGGAYITLADSIVYDNAWWSTSGTHGFANSQPVTQDDADTTSVKLAMQRNLVFGNQSSMISHVFAKKLVKLTIDEGNGLHMQNNGNGFVGRFLAEDNLSLFNGKAGLGLNTVDGGIIRNNAFYQNAQAVPGAGELLLQTSSSASVVDNLFHAQTFRETISDSSKAYAGFGSNFAVPSADSASLPASIAQVPQVFADAAAGDFHRAASIPEGNGPDPSVIDSLEARRVEYGLEPAPAPTVVDEAYLRDLRATILSSWPAPKAGDSIPDDLVLQDPDSGFCYDYGSRGNYPETGGVPCP